MMSLSSQAHIDLIAAERRFQHTERTIAHCEGILSGDGLTIADVLIAACQLRQALREREQLGRHIQRLLSQDGDLPVAGGAVAADCPRMGSYD